ncbi:PEP-CTERM sorting domain-containing protein [Paucibacter sp. TC2R-5]|uniref:PEP-CTERM sorting domain-containing protein n=1 Tax=Paucibacter sp. TC2R-5 TaxID=2893555 RepID=UPI0021E434AD|nr:PEP-CTERM sorting domain-containing protein [Paucibacter sp. TC2R-5]MCV2359371.1 PEP-CTERM sorting domain-containing protein [Paucibacter sp. TC2R-5]
MTNLATQHGHAAHGVGRQLLPLAAAALLAIAAGPSLAQQLIAPDALVAGYDQRFRLAQFSQWWISIPAATNPLLDGPGANTQLGDQGGYFFLPGSFNATPVVRNVTVRPDQTLLLNLQVVTGWPDANETEADLRFIAGHVLGTINSMSITVDGAPALLPAGYSSLGQFRQSTDLFPLHVGADNLGGWPAGIFPAISDGYLIAMEGLSAGNHQVRWTVNSSPTGPFAGQWTFEQDITYNITAVPEPGTWALMGLGLLAIGAGAIHRRRG